MLVIATPYSIVAKVPGHQYWVPTHIPTFVPSQCMAIALPIIILWQFSMLLDLGESG